MEAFQCINLLDKGVYNMKYCLHMHDELLSVPCCHIFLILSWLCATIEVNAGTRNIKQSGIGNVIGLSPTDARMLKQKFLSIHSSILMVSCRLNERWATQW